MLRVGVGQSSKVSTQEAAAQAASLAMSRAGLESADLAVVFFTVDHLSEKRSLTDIIRRVARTDRIVGSSGVGILTGEGEIEGSPAVAVLVLASDRIGTYPFLFHRLKTREEETGVALAQTIKPKTDRNSLLVLFPDAYSGHPVRLFQGLEKHMEFLPVVGAGSSENGSLGKTFQLCGEEVATNALAGVLLSGAFESSIGITQGCQPITEPLVITKARGNLIFEINNRPAFEVLTKVVKGPLLDDLRRALAFVFVGLPADPFCNGVGPGEYVVRNIVGLDPAQGILAVGEEVCEGESMIFAFRDAQRAREDLNQMLERQVKSLNGRSPQFGFYFDCCARGTSLYGIPGIDTAYIRNALGDFPLIGFFGNFELGPLGKKNHLLAYTGVLALIGGAG